MKKIKLNRRFNTRFGQVRVGLTREWFLIGARHDFPLDGWWYNIFGISMFVGNEFWERLWTRKRRINR